MLAAEIEALAVAIGMRPVVSSTCMPQIGSVAIENPLQAQETTGPVRWSTEDRPMNAESFGIFERLQRFP